MRNVAVYVDNYRQKWGRLIMSHMMADTEAELDAMALAVGLRLTWKQPAKGKRPPHFDLCESKRRQAIHLGAVPISCFDLVKKFCI